jgi:hypothetical protein
VHIDKRRSQIILSIVNVVGSLDTVVFNWLAINLSINDETTVESAASIQICSFRTVI